MVTDAVAATERTVSVDPSPMPVTMTPAPQRVVPTDTPAATVTLEPTAVPLASAGPYLLVTRSDANGDFLMALDMDGVGRQRIDLPAGYELRHSLVASLSSQGRFLALYRGSVGEVGDAHDLTLGILDLATGELATEIPLLSAEYPEDLRARFEQLKPASDPEGFPQSFRDFQSVLVYGIETLTWSPNGRYLAFAGQTDGPTSDAYVLDTQTLQRRRLSDGDEHIAYLQWSPDGRRLLTTSTSIIAMGPTNHLFSIDLQSDTNIALNADLTNIGFWLDAEHVWMDFDTNGDFSARDARIVNAATGDAIAVWPGRFDLIELNWLGRQATLIGCPLESFAEADCGQFTVDLTTGAATRLGPVVWDQVWSTQEARTADAWQMTDPTGNTLIRTGERVELVTASGERRVVPADAAMWGRIEAFALAPDGRHLFAQRYNRLERVDLETGLLTVVVADLGDPLRGLTQYDALAWATVVPSP
ncbi:MAG: PD40 domain-containing protein [Anaerolineales bacterium]|nr:PD40 domain-containing protein [Anaerolineales bacterium]